MVKHNSSTYNKFVEKVLDSITVTFTNNSSQEATISYGLSSPPDDDTVLLAAGATSDNVVFDGLDQDTTYTIFASANGTPENLIQSNIVSIQETTDVDPFAGFIDTSGSPGATFPINDLDGNIMVDLDKGVAYYGTISHTDLFTADELSAAVGVTAGTGSSDANIDEEAVWHKYYWEGGIHFWRKLIRRSINWNALWEKGAVFGTGTDTSRKGYTPDNFNLPDNTPLQGIAQDATVTKNGVTYAVRLMEGSSVDTTDTIGSPLHGSEFNLILMNLHKTTNSGAYVHNGIDEEWTDTANFTNDDFFGWVTNFGDDDFTVLGNGRWKWQQETSSTLPERRLRRGSDRFSNASSSLATSAVEANGWAPVLTVKAPGFIYE